MYQGPHTCHTALGPPQQSVCTLCNYFQAEMSSLPSLSQATASTQDTNVFLHLTACQAEGHNDPRFTRNNWELNEIQERNGFDESCLHAGLVSWSGGHERAEDV